VLGNRNIQRIAGSSGNRVVLTELRGNRTSLVTSVRPRIQTRRTRVVSRGSRIATHHAGCTVRGVGLGLRESPTSTSVSVAKRCVYRKAPPSRSRWDRSCGCSGRARPGVCGVRKAVYNSPATHTRCVNGRDTIAGRCRSPARAGDAADSSLAPDVGHSAGTAGNAEGCNVGGRCRAAGLARCQD